MKYLKCCILFVIVVFTVCGCAKGDDELVTKVSLPEKSIIDLATMIYSDMQLFDISKFNGKMTDLDKQYTIECIRRLDYGYRISFLGDNSIAILYFDNNGNVMLGKTYHTLRLKSDFERIKVGQSIEEVQNIDPDGKYLFLQTGTNDIPRVSTHCTKDGYLITIEYDSKNTIIDFSYELI